MNRIPVVNDEQRASYGAPTTDVGAGQAPELAPALVEPEPEPALVKPEPEPALVEPEPEPALVEPEPEPALVEPEPALVDKKTSKKKSA